MEEENTPGSRRKEKYIRYAILLTTISLMVAFIFVGFAYKDRLDEIKELENFGYPFVFLMGIAGCATPIWPLTGAFSVFLWAGWIGFTWIIPFMALAAGTGEAIGELSGYMLGFGGQPALEKSKKYQRIEGWMKRHRSAAIFLFSAIPFPLHVIKLINASAGAARFPIWKMFFLCWVGKIIKCLGFAVAGAGIWSWITDIF